MKETTRQILTEALNEVSPLLPDIVTYRDDLVLWGDGGLFDSIGLVNFITTLEELISDKMDKQITIVSEKAFSQSASPFRTMETLGNFIEELLKDAE
jgi:acyl carrier protein